MGVGVSSAFDSGNIRLLSIAGDRIEVEIERDHQSEFYQWFYFRVTGAADRDIELAIVNCAGAAYPGGWANYRARVSEDRRRWRQADTSYDGGVLTIRHRPRTNSLWVAYFAPYTMERHHRSVAYIASQPGVEYRTLGRTLDGQEMDCLTIGTGPRQVWLYARQHPGETMAEHWAEGALLRLVDASDPVARALRNQATFHVVPNMNPDGSRRGHLRTNAAGVNLNREWHAPSLERSPEVYHVLARMAETGVDFAMDVHGDEAIPYVFLAGFEGIPSYTDAQGALFVRYAETLARLTPDFQTKHGYPPAPRGKGNLSMSTNALAERFGCVAMTLEMPFKDNDDLPDAEFGWSAARSAVLGRDCLGALHQIIDDLR